MIAKTELKIMKDAYGILYEIENRLRVFAMWKLEKEYGVNWDVIIGKKFNTVDTRTKYQELYFHQLVSHYRVIPVLISALPSDISLQLYRINTIRNKIAHNQLISEIELDSLKQLKLTLKSLLKIKKRANEMTL
jgi:hypothetical protein